MNWSIKTQTKRALAILWRPSLEGSWGTEFSMDHGTNLGHGLGPGLVRGPVLDLEGEIREAPH